jgi:hypothetical protein
MKVVTLSALHTGRLYPPGNIHGTHFRWRLSEPQGHSADGRIMSTENANDSIGNRNHDLPVCGAVLQPTAPPCVPECLSVPLVIQYAIRMRHIAICHLPGSKIVVSTLSHKRYEVRKKVTYHKMRVLIFSTALSKTFLIRKIIERDVIVNVLSSTRDVPYQLFLSGFNET